MKEELLKLRAKLIELSREIDNGSETRVVMKQIRNLTTKINELNEEDFNQNIEKLNSLKKEFEKSEKRLDKAIEDVKKRKERFEKASDVVDLIEDVVSNCISYL